MLYCFLYFRDSNEDILDFMTHESNRKEFADQSMSRQQRISARRGTRNKRKDGLDNFNAVQLLGANLFISGLIGEFISRFAS